jgi:tRNA A-37 threonylcarbamoyl transferase component Bud32
MNISFDKYSMMELKTFASDIGLKIRRNRDDMIKDLKQALMEYEEYKIDKIDRYKKIEKIGEGKEGTAYLIKDVHGKELVMKSFRKTKSSKTMTLEFELQKKAYKKGVAPKPINIDTISKYIVMEKMDEHYFIPERKIDKASQQRILEIFKKLDEAHIFHNDINLMNFMLRKGKIYLIDYGFAKEIDSKLEKKLGTCQPNFKLMTIGLILKMKELSYPKGYYKYLLKTISKEDKIKYTL